MTMVEIKLLFCILSSGNENGNERISEADLSSHENFFDGGVER